MSEKDKKISLDTAIDWTTTWRDLESDYNSYNQCNGFLIPAEDLRGALAEIADQPNPQFVRAYLGVETIQQGDGEAKLVEKLIIVGTKPAQDISTGQIIYRDLLPSKGDSYAEDDDGDGEGSIWDFSTPCPPDCDDQSDLN